MPLAWAFPLNLPSMAQTVGCICTPIYALQILVTLRTAITQHGSA